MSTIPFKENLQITSFKETYSWTLETFLKNIIILKVSNIKVNYKAKQMYNSSGLLYCH